MNDITPSFLRRYGVEVVSFVLIVIAAAHSIIFPAFSETTLDTFTDRRVVLEGVVVRDPDRRESMTRITVLPERVGNVVTSDVPYVLVSVDRFIPISYGDRVVVQGVLKKPEPFDTDTGRTFNYPAYLRTQKITHSMSFVDVAVIGGGEGNVFVHTMLSIKHVLLRGIERAFPEPQSALLSGLLLGERQSLGERITEAFRISGVVHIIVLSGYNVALVINSVLFLAVRLFPRLVAYGIAASFVIGFAVMTGASETTIRATIMAFLMMLASVLRRPTLALRGLFIAAAVMAILNPSLVLYSLSYQLSVLATLGLIVISPHFERRLSFVSERFGLREIVATTLATQVAVLPLLIFSIGAVSLAFLPANVLVLPAVPLAMLTGFLAALIALVAPILTVLISAPAYFLLAYIINVSLFFGEIPQALITVPPSVVPFVFVGLFFVYILLFWAMRK